MNTYRPLIILILSVISLTIYATEQAPDRLIYNSDTIKIESYPLEVLMQSDSLIHNKIFGYDTVCCVSSGCWRGHVATWEIINDSLYLTNLIAGCGDHVFELDWVFGTEKVINNKVFAGWFTDELTEYQSWYIPVNGDSNNEEERFRKKIVNGKIID